jgi:hypothetical protein
MKIGLVFPKQGSATTGCHSRLRPYTERLGYSHLLVHDHVPGANPDRPGGWSGPYTHLSFNSMGSRFKTPQEHIRAIQKFATVANLFHG